MKISHIEIKNFRGIESGTLDFNDHTVLIGDNNSGKSTVLEAIDLVLGPERLSRRPVIDEHDFYAGVYIDAENKLVPITVTLTIIGLTDEQKRHFKDHLEWWDEQTRSLLDGPPAEKTNEDSVVPALRVEFLGSYDEEEDDFTGHTYFVSPVLETGQHDYFRTADKRLCGFLFLRTLRTGRRALSLERGSLLDVILRLQERRLQMWEAVLGELRKLPVADKPELGITDILTAVQDAIRLFVPSDWADAPHMRVSDLTREHLRELLTVFMGTGARRTDGSEYAAPFDHQGTGTINTLVLALLSLIADLKKNVIFAMEEPEIAIPPHTQKCIVENIRSRSSQALFTSHSPYVLEEFDPSQLLVLRRAKGALSGTPATYPPAVKPKAYRSAFRTRFCEALLARHVLIMEGKTEYDAFPAASRKLHELEPDKFKSLEAMGIAPLNAETDTQLAPLGQHFSALGKTVFALCDKQEPVQEAVIKSAISHCFLSPEKGFEELLLKQTKETALRRYALDLVSSGEWPSHLAGVRPMVSTPLTALRDALRDYLSWSKGSGGAAELLQQCSVDEMPEFIIETLLAIQKIMEPAPAETDTALTAQAVAGEGQGTT